MFSSLVIKKLSLHLPFSVNESSHSSQVWFLHCRVHSGFMNPVTSERCPLTRMRNPLSTLSLHSFLQLMEAPLVVNRTHAHIKSLENNYLQPNVSDFHHVCLSPASLKCMMTPPRSCPLSSPTSRRPRSSSSLVPKPSTWTWRRPPLWPGGCVASHCCCLCTGVLELQGLIALRLVDAVL